MNLMAFVRTENGVIYCIIAGVCCALALTAWRLANPPYEPQASLAPNASVEPSAVKPYPDDRKLEDITAAIAAIQQKIGGLEQRLERLQSATLRPHDAVQATPLTAPMLPSDGGHDVAPASVTAIQQQLLLEPLDGDASLELEQTVAEVFAENQIVNNSLLQVDCYQTACWLEFDHLDGITDEAFIEVLQNSEPFAGEFYVETLTDAGGYPRTLVILPKPGHG